MFTRKHFEAVAAILKAQDTENYDVFKAVREIARNMADVFQASNERFDRNRFMQACGFED